MARITTFQGNPLTLVGRQLQVAAAAPQFHAVTPDLAGVTLATYAGKVKIFTTFPSIDTPVCDLQVKEFNRRAASLGPDVAIIGISKDLPFAQKRFCEMFDIKGVSVISDYQSSSFGINYGVLIQELNLLARSVWIVDANDVVRYIQIVKEVTASPDYESVMQALTKVLANPRLAEKIPVVQCKPCEGGIAPLPKDTVGKLLAQSRGWQLVEDRKLVKEFSYATCAEAKNFLDLVWSIALEQGHHPILTLSFAKLKITLTTHAAGGLTENDFIMAGLIDQAGSIL